jgi:4-amino-4-deoxy-L-arabinose transferase-like glycosyltransferase
MTDEDERPQSQPGQLDMIKVGCLSGLAANLCTILVIALALVWLHNKHRGYVDKLVWWPPFSVAIYVVRRISFGRPAITSKVHDGALIVFFAVTGLVIISWLLALLGEAAGIK